MLTGNGYLQANALLVGNSVACVKPYSAFILLCSDGSHQLRHRGGRACDVGGARVDHSCAALRTKHHLCPHRDAERVKGEVENKRKKRRFSEWVHTLARTNTLCISGNLTLSL